MSDINYSYTNLTPFKWYVLENFPFIEADFDALTNWQLLCKLGKEMNKIIDSVNTSGNQVETLTTAFNELQNYVTNYFNNLDVQEEINNKLDEMAQDGTLAQIVNQYISNCILTFNTVNDMKSSEYAIKNSVCKTLGYYNANDEGGSYYIISDIQEPYSILLNNGLYANFINPNNNNINVKQFGVIGDGITDDYNNLLLLFNYIKNIGGTIINNSTILLKSSISIDDFTANCNLQGNGSFTFDLTAIAQNGLYIKTTAEFNILGNLKFDFKNQCFNGIHIVSINQLNNCKINGEYRNIRRANTNFSGGNIIYIQGGFNNVEIQAIVENALMATGAGVAGSQGITGISVVTYSENDITYVPKIVKIKNGTIINNIHSEDSSYTFDQDGLRVFGDDNSVLIVENGVIISDCAGRWVKTQTGYSDISGSYYANNYFPVVCGIGVQFGRCNIHNCNFFNNINQDFSNFGTCMINFATNPNIDSTAPTDSSFIHDINYFVNNAGNRIRKFLILSGRENHVLSNVYVSNINVNGPLYSFAQISSYNINRQNDLTNVNFENINLLSLVNRFVELTKSPSFSNSTFLNLAFNNIYVKSQNEVDLVYIYTENCYANIKSYINCKGFKSYNTSQNIFTDSNEEQYITPKNYIDMINFKQNNSLLVESSNSALAQTGETIVVPYQQTIAINTPGRINTKNCIVMAICANNKAFGLFSCYNGELGELGNNINMSTSGDSGVIVAFNEDKQITFTNNLSSSNILLDVFIFA